METESTGMITFWAQHEQPDWPTNNIGYNFPEVKRANVTASSTKHPDRTFEVRISGLFQKSFTFRAPLPPCNPKGLFVVVRWRNKEVNLLLNGQSVDTQGAL